MVGRGERVHDIVCAERGWAYLYNGMGSKSIFYNLSNKKQVGVEIIWRYMDLLP